MSENTLQLHSLRDFLYIPFRQKKKMVLFFVTTVTVVTVGTLAWPKTYRSEAKLLIRLGRETVSLDPTATIGQVAHVSHSHAREINSGLEILQSRELAVTVVETLGMAVFRKDYREPGTEDTQPGLTGRIVGACFTGVRKIASGGKSLLRGLLAGLHITTPLSEYEATVERVVDCLEVVVSKENNVLSLTCEASRPDLTQKILGAYITAYQAKHLKVHQTVGSQAFFEEQTDQLKTRLLSAQEALQTIKNQTGIASLEEQRLTLVNHIGLLEQQIAQTEADRAASQAKVKAMQETLASLPETVLLQETTGVRDYGAGMMRSTLYDLQLREQELLTHYKDNSEPVTRIRQQVAQAQAALEEARKRAEQSEVTKGASVAHQQIQLALLTEASNRASLESKIQTLHTQLDNRRADLRVYNEAEVTCGHLQREIAHLSESYRQYCEKREEARIDQALKKERISNIRIVQAATLPQRPIAPKKSLNLILGVFLGLFGALGLAFASDYLDHFIKTPDDVESKLGLVHLGSIPLFRSKDNSFPYHVQKHTLQDQDKPANIIPIEWRTPATLEKPYEVVRERLFHSLNGSMKQGTPNHVLALVGCQRGEGVSSVTSNLAAHLIQVDAGPVLVVDANMNEPAQHTIFESKLSPGLMDCLKNDIGKAGANITQVAPSFHVLATGNANRLLPGLLNRKPDCFSKTLERFKPDYRTVLVDMPPLTETSYSARLAAQCDGVILVVAAERLRWEVIQQCRQQLERMKANILGVIINKRHFPIPDWLYQAL